MAPNFEHVKRAADSSKEPRTGSVTNFNVIPPIQHLHGRCLGLPLRGYDSSCGYSNSHLHSQSKLTTAWHENRKIRYENELLKAKEPAPDVYKCQIYRMTPKNIPQNLVNLFMLISWHWTNSIGRSEQQPIETIQCERVGGPDAKVSDTPIPAL
jgi:hypothetical protein